MNLKNINFSKILEKIKSIKLTDFIYFAVIFLFFTIVVILFFYSTNFILKNVNKIFSSGNTADSWALDLANYSLVAKKLNLPVVIPGENTDVNTPTAEPTLPQNITAEPATPAVVSVLDKKSITINILNSTSKKGVASNLAKAMEDGGFSKAETGNEKKIYDLTTIIIHDSKKEYLPAVEEVVKKSYPETMTKTISDTSKFDVTIIIGKK